MRDEGLSGRQDELRTRLEDQVKLMYEAWLDEVSVSDPDAEIQATDFYTSYRVWCVRQGKTPASITRWGLQMHRHLIKRTVHGRIWYRGRRLVSRLDEAAV